MTDAVRLDSTVVTNPFSTQNATLKFEVSLNCTCAENSMISGAVALIQFRVEDIASLKRRKCSDQVQTLDVGVSTERNSLKGYFICK